jgi:hypothetical protein
MYFPWNREFGLALSKSEFPGGCLTPNPLPPVRHWFLERITWGYGGTDVVIVVIGYSSQMELSFNL